MAAPVPSFLAKYPTIASALPDDGIRMYNPTFLPELKSKPPTDRFLEHLQLIAQVKSGTPEENNDTFQDFLRRRASQDKGKTQHCSVLKIFKPKPERRSRSPRRRTSRRHRSRRRSSSSDSSRKSRSKSKSKSKSTKKSRSKSTSKSRSKSKSKSRSRSKSKSKSKPKSEMVSVIVETEGKYESSKSRSKSKSKSKSTSQSKSKSKSSSNRRSRNRSVRKESKKGSKKESTRKSRSRSRRRNDRERGRSRRSRSRDRDRTDRADRTTRGGRRLSDPQERGRDTRDSRGDDRQLRDGRNARGRGGGGGGVRDSHRSRSGGRGRGGRSPGLRDAYSDRGQRTDDGEDSQMGYKPGSSTLKIRGRGATMRNFGHVGVFGLDRQENPSPPPARDRFRPRSPSPPRSPPPPSLSPSPPRLSSVVSVVRYVQSDSESDEESNTKDRHKKPIQNKKLAVQVDDPVNSNGEKPSPPRSKDAAAVAEDKESALRAALLASFSKKGGTPKGKNSTQSKSKDSGQDKSKERDSEEENSPISKPKAKNYESQTKKKEREAKEAAMRAELLASFTKKSLTPDGKSSKDTNFKDATATPETDKAGQKTRTPTSNGSKLKASALTDPIDPVAGGSFVDLGLKFTLDTDDEI